MKKPGDRKIKKVPSFANLTQDFAFSISKKDPRLDYFWNYKPVPKLIDFFASPKKTKAIIGANRATKTTASIFEDIMIYTGIIPPSMRGVYAHEKKLRKLVSGKNQRPRHVKIIVGSYTKHWPQVIRPKLLGNPDLGEKGMLPEAWSNWNDDEHMFTGPDGSTLAVDSEDPAEKSEPTELRGPGLDHTHIDESNRQSVYSESLTRGSALPDGPGTVTLSFCPQDGFEDWTYIDLYGACYDLSTNRRKPKQAQHPHIYSISVSMRDNPDISSEEIDRIVASLPKYQVAYRVYGRYSNRLGDPYFDYDMLDQWLNKVVYSDGIPYIVEETKVDAERGIYEGKMIEVNEFEYNEAEQPVWRIWELPQDGEKYLLAADVAGGNVKSDFQSADVLKGTDPSNMKQVAQLRIRVLKPGSFAVQCACMASCYGNCLLVPEGSPSEFGGIFCDRVRSYKNFYTRIMLDKTTEHETEKIGWSTNKSTKPLMLETLYKTLHEQNAKNICPIRSKFTLSELMSYEERVVKDKLYGYMRTEWGSARGAHDDTVISLAIGNRIIQTENYKLSTCNLKKNTVETKLSPLEEKSQRLSQMKNGVRFGGLRKQPSLQKLMKQHKNLRREHNEQGKKSDRELVRI